MPVSFPLLPALLVLLCTAPCLSSALLWPDDGAVPELWQNRQYDDPATEIEYLRYLASGVAINNTIILVPTNKEFLHFSLNLDCSLRRLKLPQVLFWALDPEADQFLRLNGQASYYNPSLYGAAHHMYYHDDDYNRMMRERAKVWLWVLKAGYSFLWMDADTVALGNPLEALTHDADLEIQTDDELEDVISWSSASQSSEGCAGLFYLRATPGSISLIENVQALLDKDEEIEDQQAINLLLHSKKCFTVNGTPDRNAGITETGTFVRFVHPLRWINGHQLDSITYKDGSWFWVPEEEMEHQIDAPLVIHANGCWDKEAVLRRYDGWLLDEGFRCLRQH